jgi:PAS domain-containing protein
VSERTTRARRKSSSVPRKTGQPVKRKATFVADKDVLPNLASTKILGSANTVERTTLNTSQLIRGGPTVYFKPGKHVAQYAVASTRLATFLGMQPVISHNAFAKIKNTDGFVSGEVLGVPLRAVEHAEETQIPDVYKTFADRPATPADIQNWLLSKGTEVIAKDGKFFKLTGFVYNQVDFKDPRVQKGMSDLQIFDAISGQQDRHGGNIYVNPRNGKVTGIDDDLAMRDSGYRVDERHDKYPGLPPLVDRATADKILAARPETLPTFLARRDGDLKDLSPKEIRLAAERLADVQDHIRKLETTGGIVDVGAWGDRTYAKLMEHPDLTYLGRSETDLQGAIGGQPMDGYPSKVGPPLDAPPPLPVQPPPIAQPVAQPLVPAWAVVRPKGDQPRPTPIGSNRPVPVQFPPLPAVPGWGVLPSSSAMQASVSRLATERLRSSPREKEKVVSPPPTHVDSSESESDDSITLTPAEDRPQGGGLTVSQSPDNEPTEIETQVTALEALVRELSGGSISPRRDIEPTDVGTRLKVLNDWLIQLTGGSRDE